MWSERQAVQRECPFAGLADASRRLYRPPVRSTTADVDHILSCPDMKQADIAVLQRSIEKISRSSALGTRIRRVGVEAEAVPEGDTFLRVSLELDRTISNGITWIRWSALSRMRSGRLMIAFPACILPMRRSGNPDAKPNPAATWMRYYRQSRISPHADGHGLSSQGLPCSFACLCLPLLAGGTRECVALAATT